MSAPLPPKAELADHLLNGRLADLIEQEKAQKSSYEHIARLIWAQTEGRISVTGVTVQAWHDRMREAPKAAS